MLLPPEEAKQFLRLYTTLLGFAAGQMGGVAGVKDLPSWYEANAAAKMEVRDALFAHRDLIDRYLAQNPDHLTDEEREILAQWKEPVRGNFAILRDLKRYTAFLTAKEPFVAYGVLGLTTEITDLLAVPLPALADATLLAWKGLIVCDGLINGYRVMMGPSYRKTFSETYRETVSQSGIVTSLGETHDRGFQTRARVQSRRRSPLERFLKSCPRTVTMFKERYGEPRLDMANAAAKEYGPWRLDGTPAMQADYLMIFGNILKDQVLYVYSVQGEITHVSVVDPTD